MNSSLSWLSQSCISLLSSGSKFGLVRRKYWTAPLPPCSFLEVKPYLRGSDCEISWDVTAKCSGLCVPIAPGQHFLHTGTACSSSATFSIHKKTPGTRHRHLKTQLRGQQEFRFHCQTLLYWGREFLLLLAWNNKFVVVLPKTQPRSCPRWALWVSGASNLTWCSQGAEKFLKHSCCTPEVDFAIWMFLLKLTFGVNISHSPIHLPRGWEPQTMLSSILLTKRCSVSKSIFHSHTQPSKIYFYSYKSKFN